MIADDVVHRQVGILQCYALITLWTRHKETPVVFAVRRWYAPASSVDLLSNVTVELCDL